MCPTGLKEAVEVTEAGKSHQIEWNIEKTAQTVGHRDKALIKKEVWMDKLIGLSLRRGGRWFSPATICSYFNFIGK